MFVHTSHVCLMFVSCARVSMCQKMNLLAITADARTLFVGAGTHGKQMMHDEKEHGNTWSAWVGRDAMVCMCACVSDVLLSVLSYLLSSTGHIVSEPLRIPIQTDAVG